MSGTLKGTCLCGSVSVEITPQSNHVDACHCSMCRKWSGGPYMAIACGSNMEISGDTIGTYISSDWAERKFCNKCGTVIAWVSKDGQHNHVSSQLFQESDDFDMGTQVFIDEKPNTYSFEQKTKTLTGAEIFAMFASPEGSEQGNAE